jgi:methyl-accepting chemotaxis protein
MRRRRRISAVVAALCPAFGFAVSRSIVAPLAEAQALATHIANGDLTREVSVHGNDEAAQTLQSLKRMTDSLRRIVGEVRSLAQRSAEAAREIKSLISSSVERVDAGSRLVQDAGSTMTDIVASVKRVCDTISEITAAVTEQSAGIGEVNGTVTQLDQMTQRNAALVEQSAAAADSLKEQANKLATAVSSFRIH